jgi:CBS domain-containing protein
MATIERHVTRDLLSLSGNTPCNEAARIMVQEHVGSIAVRDGSRIVGIVTERDLVTEVLAGGARGDMPIREAMGKSLPTVTPQSTEVECTKLMRDNDTRYLLVREGTEIIGIISMRDLIRLMLDDKEWLISQLHNFIQGHDGPPAEERSA